MNLPRLIDLALSSLIIISFFMPWLQFEMALVNGLRLNELALEYYGPSHILSKLVYALYALPILAILVISASLFGVTRYMLGVKILMLVIVGVIFYLILGFHQSENFNIWMRYGVIVSAVCCVLLVVLAVISRWQTWRATK